MGQEPTWRLSGGQSTLQHGALQRSATVQHSTPQHSVAQRSAAQLTRQAQLLVAWVDAGAQQHVEAGVEVHAGCVAVERTTGWQGSRFERGWPDNTLRNKSNAVSATQDAGQAASCRTGRSNAELHSHVPQVDARWAALLPPDHIRLLITHPDRMQHPTHTSPRSIFWMGCPACDHTCRYVSLPPAGVKTNET